MADLGKAYVQIVPSAQGISGEITNTLKGEANEAGKETGSLIGNNLVSTLKTVLVAAGIGTIIKSAIGSVGELAAIGDEIDKMSQKMGISAQAYQEWDAILQHSGTSIEAMKPAFKTLVNAAEQGSDAFQELGISQEEVANMNQEELFARTIAALQDMESDTQRAYLASKLLGKGGTELGALLNTSAAETEAMRQKVHELGGVMSDEAIKSSAAYQDALQDMKTAMTGLGRGLVAQFLPDFTKVMDGVTKIFSGDTGGGVAIIVEGLKSIGNKIVTAIPEFVKNIALMIKSIIEELAKNMPQFLERGKEFILKMIDGIMQKMPSIITNMGTLLSNLIAYIMQKLPDFLVKGMEFVGKMAMGILRNLPAIMSALASVLGNLLRTIMQNYPQYVSKGYEMIKNMIVGIVKAIPEIIRTLLQIVKDMIAAFNPNSLVSAGFDMLMGLAKGIANAVGNVVASAKQAAANILGGVKSFFGIASPSKVMAKEVGRWIPAGIAMGIEDNMKPLDDAMSNLVDDTILDTNSSLQMALGNGNISIDNTSVEGALISRIDAMLYLMQEYYPDMAKGLNGDNLINGIDRSLGLAVI